MSHQRNLLSDCGIVWFNSRRRNLHIACHFLDGYTWEPSLLTSGTAFPITTFADKHDCKERSEFCDRFILVSTTIVYILAAIIKIDRWGGGSIPSKHNVGRVWFVHNLWPHQSFRIPIPISKEKICTELRLVRVTCLVYSTENTTKNVHYATIKTNVPPVQFYLQQACPFSVEYLLEPAGKRLELQHTCQHQLCTASPSVAGRRIEQP